eukprot:g19089.t1
MAVAHGYGYGYGASRRSSKKPLETVEDESDSDEASTPSDDSPRSESVDSATSEATGSIGPVEAEVIPHQRAPAGDFGVFLRDSWASGQWCILPGQVGQVSPLPRRRSVTFKEDVLVVTDTSKEFIKLSAKQGGPKRRFKEPPAPSKRQRSAKARRARRARRKYEREREIERAHEQCFYFYGIWLELAQAPADVPKSREGTPPKSSTEVPADEPPVQAQKESGMEAVVKTNPQHPW